MSGAFTPCISMFMLPMRSIVVSKSKPWNIEWWKCRAWSWSTKVSGCFARTYSLAEHPDTLVDQAQARHFHHSLNMPRLGQVDQGVGMLRPHVLAGGHEEARRAAGRIADLVARRRRHHVHHQLDDVARGAELAVHAGGGDLREQVLVQITVGIAVIER